MNEHPIYHYRVVQRGEVYIVKANHVDVGIFMIKDADLRTTLYLDNQIIAVLSGEYMVVRVEEENQA